MTTTRQWVPPRAPRIEAPGVRVPQQPPQAAAATAAAIEGHRINLIIGPKPLVPL